MGTRAEIITRNEAAYRKAKKKGKGKILDIVCDTTGISRSRARHLFSKPKTKKPSKRRTGRKPKYTGTFIALLETVWAYMDFACGKRLTAGMDDILTALIAHGALTAGEEDIAKLKTVSPATVDRLLSKAKQGLTIKGKSTTKPGTLLKRDIPIRLGNEWDDAVPGFVEIDLVAHCGETTSGEYVNTLSITDICSGWTETAAVRNKAQKHVFEALMAIEERQPFKFKGIDSDNGSEFINNELYRWCKQNDICFTRSRPGKKNDNCHVEQKNWHVVRRNIGYGRYEGQEATDTMNEYYSLLRLYANFFLPQVKLLRKIRDGAHVKKVYDKPTSPFRRLLGCEHILPEVKAALQETYEMLNPAALKKDMVSALQRLESYQVINKLKDEKTKSEEG